MMEKELKFLVDECIELDYDNLGAYPREVEVFVRKYENTEEFKTFIKPYMHDDYDHMFWSEVTKKCWALSNYICPLVQETKKKNLTNSY